MRLIPLHVPNGEDSITVERSWRVVIHDHDYFVSLVHTHLTQWH